MKLQVTEDRYMFITSLRMQMSEMIRKKSVVVTFLILFSFVMVNFFINMTNFFEIKYISQMYDPIKVLTLSEWSVSGYFMMEYYPLLVVIPTACAYLTDKNTRVKIYIESKTGKETYWFTKALSVFITTFFVFTIPFLTEILLEVICFSMESAGDPTGFTFIQTVENENQHLFSELWVENKIVYAVIMMLLFGMVSGILALFNFAVSALPFFKYKIFTFFPIYVIFYSISIIQHMFKIDYTLNYFYVLRMFNTEFKNYVVYLLFLFVLVTISFIIIKYKCIKDDLI